MPVPWRNHFVLGGKASASSFGSTGAACHPRLRVCPMGWQLAVDVIQEAHLEFTLSWFEGLGLLRRPSTWTGRSC
eukprot:6165189-Amphidinium_carterae.1